VRPPCRRAARLPAWKLHEPLSAGEAAIPEPHDSYARCLAVPTFVGRFYARFFSDNPAVARYFIGVDWSRQQQLLRAAVPLLVLAPGGNAAAHAALERLGRLHGAGGVGIDDADYDRWADCFIATVRECDERWSPVVEAAWRRTLAHGIAVMRRAALNGPGSSGCTR
jgi:hemoglobin-like flavoprotein